MSGHNIGSDAKHGVSLTPRITRPHPAQKEESRRVIAKGVVPWSGPET